MLYKIPQKTTFERFNHSFSSRTILKLQLYFFYCDAKQLGDSLQHGRETGTDISWAVCVSTMIILTERKESHVLYSYVKLWWLTAARQRGWNRNRQSLKQREPEPDRGRTSAWKDRRSWHKRTRHSPLYTGMIHIINMFISANPIIILSTLQAVNTKLMCRQCHFKGRDVVEHLQRQNARISFKSAKTLPLFRQICETSFTVEKRWTRRL